MWNYVLWIEIVYHAENWNNTCKENMIRLTELFIKAHLQLFSSMEQGT